SFYFSLPVKLTIVKQIATIPKNIPIHVRIISNHAISAYSFSIKQPTNPKTVSTHVNTTIAALAPFDRLKNFSCIQYPPNQSVI
ncbi:MAG: hypothetical protein IKC68_02060, partial [Bacteroidales bacterium]|nr:hypothetical protein [Bacteroidales bacterium]